MPGKISASMQNFKIFGLKKGLNSSLFSEEASNSYSNTSFTSFANFSFKITTPIYYVLGSSKLSAGNFTGTFTLSKSAGLTSVHVKTGYDMAYPAEGHISYTFNGSTVSSTMYCNITNGSHGNICAP